MVVKEAWVEVEGDGLTLQIRGLEGTVLIVVTDGHTVRHTENVALADPS